MSTTLTWNEEQGLVLPPGLLLQAKWDLQGSVDVQIDEERIVMQPVRHPSPDLLLLKKRGKFVISGLPAANDEQVVAAIQADRMDRGDAVLTNRPT